MHIADINRATSIRAPSVQPGRADASRDDGGTTVHETDGPDLRARFLYCLKVFLGVRIGLGILALVGTALVLQEEVVNVPGWPAPAQTPGWHNIFTAWEKWDALWFLRIADVGYSDADPSAAFFPLYPILIRAVAPLLGGHPLAAALLISNLAYLGALFTVYELTRLEFDDRYARRTVLYLALFPTAFFFLAPYTESLFLLFSAGSLLAAKRKQWAFAGALGALAAATRSIGLVLIVALALEALSQARASEGNRMSALMKALPWAALPGVGAAAYLFYWYRTNGDWLTPLRDQSGWLREFHYVWETLVNGTRTGFEFIGSYAGGFHQLDWIVVTVALAALVWVVLHARPTYIAYTFVSLVIPLSFIFGGRPFMSVPRFIAVLFPLFWALVAFADRFRAHELVVAASAAGLGVCTLLFVNWYFIF